MAAKPIVVGNVVVLKGLVTDVAPDGKITVTLIPPPAITGGVSMTLDDDTIVWGT